MVKSCWICKTSGNKLNKSYFRIPKILFHRNPEISELSALRLEKWRDALLLPDDVSGIRICSDHFLSGNPARLLDINDPDWIPTKNLKPNHIKNVDKLKTVKVSKLGKIDGVQKSSQEADKILCRLCIKLVSKEFCINIFQEPNIKIIKMIATVLNHKIAFEEDISPYTCSSCLKKVRVCSRLLTHFRTNEKRLRSLKNSRAIECVQVDEKSPKRKVEETDEGYQQTVSTDADQKNDESSVPEMTEDVRIGGVYDSEQIRSIIEDNSVSSDENSTEDGKFIKCKRRKYDFQSVNVRPIERKTLKCNNCFRKFPDLDGLKMHKNFCKLFYCQLCKPQIIFRERDERERHKKTYHGHSLVCHICGKNYSQSYLVKHFKNHFEDRKKCPFCGKTLKNVTILMAHVDNVHGNRFSSICEICGGNFKNLKKHLSECGKSVSN